MTKLSNVNPGDIIFTNAKTTNSIFIQIFTGSTLSHAMIASPDGKVFESTFKKNSPENEFRNVSLDKAIEGATRVEVYHRVPPLTDSQITTMTDTFNRIDSDPEAKKYRRRKAFQSGNLWFMRKWLKILMAFCVGYSIYHSFFIIDLVYILVAGTFGIPLIKIFSRLLAKKFPHNKLTKKMTGTFCSGFVAEVEKKLGSKIYDSLVYKDEDPRPVDLARACRKSGVTTRTIYKFTTDGELISVSTKCPQI
ncbi:hypothetical protein ACPV5O_11495 [Vibrio maritimus]|uniref:hypothetical protein n=1 Tax=Vibrio maritimus TaxID=990268 RepID=UPI004067FEFD